MDPNSDPDPNNAVTIPNDCVLRFNGGKLSNGFLVGNRTRIENLTNGVIFDNVGLSSVFSLYSLTGWLGECKDDWFVYDETTKSHYKIVKSVCQFEVCHFSKRKYYLETWETIHLRALGCTIDGGDATFIITKSKGGTELGGDNIPRYQKYSLFAKECPNLFPNPSDPNDPDYYKNGDKAGAFSVSDLTIIDDDSLTDDPSFGADMSVFVNYTIFYGSGNQTIFRNVRYEGCGCLLNDYNYRVAIHEAIFDNCHVRNSQFAISIGNLLHTNLASECPPGGSCDRMIIRNCSFYNYALNPYVGPLSVVNSGANVYSSITKCLLIEQTRFESQKESNLEVAGCESVEIRNCVFKSVQCSSENSTYKVDQNTTAPINKEMIVIDNTFAISNDMTLPQGGLRICSGDLHFVHNVVYFDFVKPSSGSFLIEGYGENEALLCGNTIILSGMHLTNSKTILAYQSTKMRLTDNNYVFQEDAPQGYEVHVDSRDDYYDLEIEDDPRFRNRGGGDYYAWQRIPDNKRTAEGLLAKGETLEIEGNLPSDHIVEFDLEAYAIGADKGGTQRFLSFKTGTVDVYVHSYYGLFGIQVGQDTYSSGSGARLALPRLGFETMGKELGSIKIVFWKESSSQTTTVLLYINNRMVDSFVANYDIFAQNLSSLKLYGTPYLRIKHYRIRQYGKIANHPQLHSLISMNPNDGFATSGTSSGRPAAPEVGYMYFDTTLSKPVFFTGNGWIDATGTSV